MMGEDSKTKYKDTLNLPQTDFDMRGRLLVKEPAMHAKWRGQKLYHQIRKLRDGAPRFILHDGPPYANGNIHMGQALNKVLKDIVVRIKTMSGYDAPYIPGWDCHGQPIEQKIVEQLGEKMETMTPMEIRRKCQAYAEKFVNVQSQQFQQLGVMGEFENPYITMSPQYEAGVLEVFARLVEQGVVYRQLKPVHWSIANRTALADAELEYHDREDLSIYVTFKLLGEAGQCLPHRQGDALGLMIWTTTPWTLPANRAVAVHPNFEYCCVHAETADGPATFVIAEGRIEAVVNTIRRTRGDWLGSCEVTGKLTGRELIDAKLTYEHPLVPSLVCPVVPADYVTLEDGTGLVHTAPGHGLEDYGTALKQELEVYCPVIEDGTFDSTGADWLVGVSVWDANDKIVKYLRDAGTLVLAETITHSYPHDWRSKTPTIFRATEQWFVGVDRQMTRGSTLREMAMAACRLSPEQGGMDFVPAWGRNRLAGMLESRPDWCISRQRSWGLPIPAFYDPAGRALLTPASVRAVARHFAERGSDSWFNDTAAAVLADYDPAEDPDRPQDELLDVSKLRKGADILDVWFESGSSWFAAALQRGLVKEIPVDLYLEGSDQHRGWFQLSLLPALGARLRAPFRTVLTHGFVVTEDGHKMSKSLGNAIDVIEQLDKRGADILRLWIASQNYQDDVRCSDKLIARAEDAYRKIRNTLRFCMGACADFDPAEDAQTPAEHSIDRWMKMELHRLIHDVRAAYDRYEFHRASRLIYEFCTVQASSIYLSSVKDRLYCESSDAVRRRASQTVIHQMLVALIKLLAPILPHTAEEAWDHIPNRDPAAPHSVHLSDLPDCDEQVLELAEDLRPVNPDLGMFSSDELQVGPAWVWNQLLELRSAGLVKLETLRNTGVKNPLDAEAVIKVSDKADTAAQFVETYLPELEDLLGVGYARMERSGELTKDNPIEIEVLDARKKYQRCARSWRRRPDVGSDSAYPDLCARDAAVMSEITGK
ncbi:MAG: isoleucine--tRNA ligase [Phycisphaerae bacterium]|nr:isoleucine--tRNA ligase [Phycisphaerae bacterium]